MVEVIKARDYYHRPVRGWVLLVNGQPYHYRYLRDIPDRRLINQPLP